MNYQSGGEPEWWHPYIKNTSGTVPLRICHHCGGAGWHFSNCPTWLMYPDRFPDSYGKDFRIDVDVVLDQHPLPSLTESEYFESIDYEG